MKPMKIITLATALALSAQPCIAAAAETAGASVGAALRAPGAERVAFKLKPGPSSAASSAAMASLTLAASQQTASEAQDQPRRRGLGTTTLLIVGGVLLLVVLAAAVAGAAPSPGPDEGAFD